MPPTVFRTLAIAMITALGGGCAPTTRGTPTEAMLTQTSQLVGSWKKSTRSTYSHPYPDTIQFREGGLYFGQKDPPGTFTQWDAGTFEVIDSEQIRVSTANDAIVAYGFSLSNNVLKFVDPDGCEFSYRRVS